MCVWMFESDNYVGSDKSFSSHNNRFPICSNNETIALAIETYINKIIRLFLLLTNQDISTCIPWFHRWFELYHHTLMGITTASSNHQYLHSLWSTKCVVWWNSTESSDQSYTYGVWHYMQSRWPYIWAAFRSNPWNCRYGWCLLSQWWTKPYCPYSTDHFRWLQNRPL